MEVTRARTEAAQNAGSALQEAVRTPENRSAGRQDRPGKVIALLNQKGGAGKTTLATHLAGELAMAGSRVTLLDADPQGSALDWAQRRLQNGKRRLYGVFGLARDSLHQEAPQIALEADYVVIDGPPRVAALARSALLAADLVLIPVQPSAYDVWASHEMVALIAEARVFRPQLRAAFVINRRVVGTVIGREARAALADQPFAALQTEVSQRIVFADSVAAGRLACEAAPKCAAAREIAALAQAVQEMLR
ncbi:MAG: ParA family partition ATPase [Acidovorax sp.]|uniref:ParA family partition ATPase n=1 Tax=Acidovorax sp. TaxID=1872122 RepID=UPI00391D3533